MGHEYRYRLSEDEEAYLRDDAKREADTGDPFGESDYTPTLILNVTTEDGELLDQITLTEDELTTPLARAALADDLVGMFQILRARRG